MWWSHHRLIRPCRLWRPLVAHDVWWGSLSGARVANVNVTVTHVERTLKDLTD